MTVTAWASAFIGIRDAGEQISAGALSLGRLLIGAAALGAIVAIRREPLPARSDLPAIAFCGLLWFGIYNVALNEAERHVDAGTAAMLVNVGPIMIALLAGVVLHEGFPRSLLAGSAVAFAGAILIGVATSDDEGAYELALPGPGSYTATLDVDTLPDDVKLTDAELLGMPWILTVSPRSLAGGGVEVTRRDTGERRTTSIEEVEGFLRSGVFAEVAAPA